MQQLLVSFLFNINVIDGFKNVDDEYRWCCAYGMLLCTESLLFSLFITFKVFNPRDLMLWDDTDILLANVSTNDILLANESSQPSMRLKTDPQVNYNST